MTQFEFRISFGPEENPLHTELECQALARYDAVLTRARVLAQERGFEVSIDNHIDCHDVACAARLCNSAYETKNRLRLADENGWPVLEVESRVFATYDRGHRREGASRTMITAADDDIAKVLQDAYENAPAFTTEKNSTFIKSFWPYECSTWCGR